MDWENHLEKKTIQKIKKTVKIKVKLPHVIKKPLGRKQIFVQTPFSHSTLNLEQKIFTPQNHSLFRSTSGFLKTYLEEFRKRFEGENCPYL